MRRFLCALFALLFVFGIIFPVFAEESTEPTEAETQTMVHKQYKHGELVCTYTFTVYGYGHGVGMSQRGAAAYADTNGRFRWNYVQILLHYYPQTHMAYEEDVPQSLSRGGASYTTREFLAHSTMAEMGGMCTANNKEAVKAQVVAIYTFLKNHGYSSSTGGVAYTSAKPFPLIYTCVDEVLGQYVAYDGSNKACTGLFAASFPSWTASSGGTWGGRDYQGLSGGVYSPEKVSISTVTMDAEDIIAIANTYNQGKPADKRIRLEGDPSTWLEILEHDGAYSQKIGHVTKLRIGNQTMSGNSFKTLLFRVSGVPGLRSHCFSLKYDLVPGEDVQGNEADAYSTERVVQPE